MSLAGRVALVTGTTGIGAATALRLATDDARVLAVGVDRDGAAALARRAIEAALPTRPASSPVPPTTGSTAASWPVWGCDKPRGSIDGSELAF